MTKRVRITFLLAAMIITSCSGISDPVTTREKPNHSANDLSKEHTFLTAKEIADLDKEYSAFKTKALTMGYLGNKLKFWLDTDNGPKLLKEIEYCRIKTAVGDTLKTLFASVPVADLYNRVVSANAITTAIAQGNSPLGLFLNTTANPLPGIPGSLSADTITSAGFTARWGSVSNATAYEIMVNNTGPFIVATGTSYAASITGTNHTFKVRAIKNALPGSYSTVFNVPVIPAVPNILATDNITSSGFRANWSPVSGATGYEIKIGTNTFSAGTNTFYNATGLTGTSQSFQVRAIKDSATGDYSNPTNVALPDPSLLLDTYPSAALAYSLRKVTNSYSGNAIRVRRSSDNAEQNIGFVNNSLDTTTLQSFVGSANGYITTWYDQSGNTRNATQSTLSNQPVLVSSGVILTNLGKPSIKFNPGTSHNLVNSSFNLVQPNSAYVVAHYGGTTSQNYIFSSAVEASGGTNAILRNNFHGKWDLYAGSELFGPATVTGNYFIEGYFKTISSSLYLNSNLVASGNTGGGSMQGITIGNYAYTGGTNYTWGSFINEIIIYNSDQLPNRAGIGANINAHYSVY